MMLRKLLLAGRWRSCSPAAPGFQPAFARDALDELQARIIDVNKEVSPAVVHIESAVRVNNRRDLIEGSGFVIEPSGVAAHELARGRPRREGERVVTGRDGRYDAEVVGTDKQTDVAVLRTRPARGREAVRVRASSATPTSCSVGEWVIAIGNPVRARGLASRSASSRPRAATCAPSSC